MRLYSSYAPKFITASLASAGILGMLLLSACDELIQDFTENTSADTPVEQVVEEDKTIETVPEIIILQDGVDAFLGYKHVDIPENLDGTYPALKDGILAFILAFDLRETANEEGVSAWAKTRTSKAGETTWQYELNALPDDSVYAIEYKVYFEKLDTNYRIARIGHRVKCYRGANPKQWTVELCP